MKIHASARLRASPKPFKVTPGMWLYHTTSAIYAKFRKRPTWFTPTENEAKGYRQGAGAKSFTLICEWLGGKVATEKECMPYVLQVWPDYEESVPIYSMFDEYIGEWDKADVKKFIKLLTAAGYAGAIHADYSAVNPDRDAYTLVVFDPTKSVKVVGVQRS